MYLHRDPILVRLDKLAESGRTGALRLSGEFGGAIYLDEGGIVYAESRRTPPPAPDAARSPGLPAENATAGALQWQVAVREATVDALVELLSGRSRTPPRQRFRTYATPDVGGVGGMSVTALADEVKRRQEILKRLSPLLTPDTTIARNSRPALPSVQVSAGQWTLLSRMGERSTPRDLAPRLGLSVFGTTVEMFRLVVLGLLRADDEPWPSPVATGSDQSPDPRRTAMSFLRAVDPAIGAAGTGGHDGSGTGKGDS